MGDHLGDVEDFQEPFPSPNRASSHDEDPSAHFERLQGGRQSSKLHARERREVLAQSPQSEQSRHREESKAIRDRHVAESLHAMMLNGHSNDPLGDPISDRKSNGYTGYNNTTEYTSRHHLQVASRRGTQGNSRAVSDPVEKLIIDPDRIVLSQPHRAHAFRTDKSKAGRQGLSDSDAGSFDRESMTFKDPRRVDALRGDHGRAAQAPTRASTRNEHREAGRADSVAVPAMTSLGNSSSSTVRASMTPGSMRLSQGGTIPTSKAMRGDALMHVVSSDSVSKASVQQTRYQRIKPGEYADASMRDRSSFPMGDVSSSVRSVASAPSKRTTLDARVGNDHRNSHDGSRVSAHSVVCRRMESTGSESLAIGAGNDHRNSHDGSRVSAHSVVCRRMESTGSQPLAIGVGNDHINNHDGSRVSAHSAVCRRMESTGSQPLAIGVGNDHINNHDGSRVSAHSAVCRRMESTGSQPLATTDQTYQSHEVVNGASAAPRRHQGQQGDVMGMFSGVASSRISKAPPLASNNRQLQRGWGGTDTMSTVAGASRPGNIRPDVHRIKRKASGSVKGVGSLHMVTTHEGAVAIEQFTKLGRKELIDGTMKPRSTSIANERNSERVGVGDQTMKRNPGMSGQTRAPSQSEAATVRVTHHRPSTRIAVRDDAPPRASRVVEAKPVASHTMSHSRSSQVPRDVTDTGGIFASDFGQLREAEHRDTTNARGRLGVDRLEAVQSHFTTNALPGAPETTTKRNPTIGYDEAPPRVDEMVSTPRHLPREYTETSSARGVGDSSWMPEFGGEKVVPRVQHGDNRKARGHCTE